LSAAVVLHGLVEEGQHAQEEEQQQQQEEEEEEEEEEEVVVVVVNLCFVKVWRALPWEA
jgi:hypothetical protein